VIGSAWPTTEELIEYRISMAISESNQRIYKYLKNSSWLDYAEDYHDAKKIAFTIKVCKAAVIIDQCSH
jgi:hypothetical protein